MIINKAYLWGEETKILRSVGSFEGEVFVFLGRFIACVYGSFLALERERSVFRGRIAAKLGIVLVLNTRFSCVQANMAETEVNV
jgi:hypothetical protein